MARDYENEAGVRIAPLSELKDFEVAEGYPDIRGWRVDSTDGTEVGRVHDLLVDADRLRTRYIDLRLTPEIAATPGERDVLVPIGAAHLDEQANRVILPLPAERVGLLPPYDHGRVTRAYEYEIRRHFSLGQAAAAAAGTVGATAARDFYDDERYDDRRLFSTRHADSRQLKEPMAADTQRDVRADETGVRIPVAPDESVVLRRGDDGRDEVIIRRPVDGDARAR
jgi:photosynthetic reaction center H subunit